MSIKTYRRIRSNIHAIRVANSLSNSTGNGSLLPDTELQILQNQVDEHLIYLTTAMDTGKYTTELQNALDAMEETISNLH